MKTLVAGLLLSFLSLSRAADFTLQFDYDKPAIIYDSKDWTMIWASDDFEMHLAPVYTNNSGPDLYEMHSMVVFPNPGREFRGIQGTSKKIYSYGVIDCVRKALLLRIEYWVDYSETIIFDRDYSSDSTVVYLDDPGTARAAVLDYVCNKT